MKTHNGSSVARTTCTMAALALAGLALPATAAWAQQPPPQGPSLTLRQAVAQAVATLELEADDVRAATQRYCPRVRSHPFSVESIAKA